ncbi:MAG: ABC transporter permease [Oscillospiraceae bacterium]|jgi:ABC-2 type transport system permease protein|nr:ABC transporter permease [Oscillospiraceae bacterium]
MTKALRFHWNNFLKYRFLLKEIVRKNVRLQYRDSWLGMAWTMLQPLLFSLVLAFVFSVLFKRSDVGGVPFFVYLLSGRLMFSFFSDSTQRAMRSVRQNAGILKKVYVPKYIYPMGNIISTFITFLFSLVVLVVIVIYYDIHGGTVQGIHYDHFSFGLHKRVLFAVVPVVILLVLSMGVGLLLSSISVFFKDTEFIYSVLCQLLMYFTPIFYSAKEVQIGGGDIASWQTELLKKILRANPLYGIITIFRNSIFCSPGQIVTEFPGYYSFAQLAYTSGFAIVMLIVGSFVFYKVQDKFILHL